MNPAVAFDQVQSCSHSVLAKARVLIDQEKNSRSIAAHVVWMARVSVLETKLRAVLRLVDCPVVESLAADKVRAMSDLMTEAHDTVQAGVVQWVRSGFAGNPLTRWIVRRIERHNSLLSRKAEYLRAAVDEERLILQLSRRDQYAVAASLLDPAPASESLRAAVRRHTNTPVAS